MKTLLLIFIPSVRKYIQKNHKKPEAVKKRFLSREKDKIDKKIDSALILGDYSSAMFLTGKMNKNSFHLTLKPQFLLGKDDHSSKINRELFLQGQGKVVV